MWTWTVGRIQVEGVAGSQRSHLGTLGRPLWSTFSSPLEGSRNLCVSVLPAVKNQVTGSFILNPKGKEALSQTFTALGLEWEHEVEDTKDSLKTSGPLPEAIAVLVSPIPGSGPARPLPCAVCCQPAQTGDTPMSAGGRGAGSWAASHLCLRAGRVLPDTFQSQGVSKRPRDVGAVLTRT